MHGSKAALGRAGAPGGRGQNKGEPQSKAVGGGRTGHMRTVAHGSAETVDTSISSVGNGITRLVLINSVEEDCGRLAEKRGFAFVDPSTARHYRYRKLSLFV